MSIDIFDKYDIRARICSLMFILSPIVLDGYILLEEFRDISFTIVLLAVILSYSCFFTCWIRYNGNKVKIPDYIIIFLKDGSDVFSKNSLKRYYEKLNKLESTFSLSVDLGETEDSKLKDVSTWLKQKTRDEQFNLVKEECINYGFIRNLYSMKKIYLIMFSIYSLILVGLSWLKFKDCNAFLTALSAKEYTCVIIHFFTFFVWIFGITKKILDFVAKKYAKAIIESIDRL